MVNQEIVIGLRVQLNNLKSALNTAKKELSDLEKTLQKNMSKLRGAAKSAYMRGSNYQELSANIQKAKTNVAALEQQMYKTNNRLKRSLGELPFAGWAMSIMFFGMAIQRMFMGVWKSSTAAFQEISHSVEGTTTGFDLLQGSLKYLGFSVGQALEPFAEKLVPIIDSVTELVNEFPNLTKNIIVGGIALGTFFFVLGTGVLAFNGFKQAALLFFGKDLITSLIKAGGVVGWLKTTFLALKTVITSMSLTSLLGIGGLIAGIILAVLWIFKLKEAIGGWGEFFKSVLRGVLRVFVIIIESIAFGWMKVLEGIVWTLNKIISFYNTIASKVGLGTIGQIKMDKHYFGDALLSKYVDWEQDKLAPEKGYATGGGIVPTFNINTLNIQSNEVDSLHEQIRRATGG